MSLLPRLFRTVGRLQQWMHGAAPPAPSEVASTAATLDLASPGIARDPFPHYEALRRDGPVQFLPRHDAWIVLGYEEVHAALLQPQLFSSVPYAAVDGVLLGADPPAHTGIRRIVSRHFTSEVISRLGAVAERQAAALLTPEIELVTQYAAPIGEAVAADLLGLDAGTVAAIHAAEASATTFADFTAALDRLAERSTMHPLLLADDLTDGEARSLVRLLWLAATHTTTRGISWCARCLLEDDSARRAVERNPSLLDPLVDEVIRLHPPELVITRRTTADVVLGGVSLPPGALVHLALAAANRDPARYADPAILQLDRPVARHLGFGAGVHHCIGATLARRTIAIAIRTLLERAPHFCAAAPLTGTTEGSSLTANPIERLLITTGRAAP
jgi:hypothetical protein